MRDGYLRFLGRTSDVINVGGEKVYPAEVEEMLPTHPAVAEAAVVGVAHPHTGEAVKAYVVTNADVDEDTLVEYCQDYLARYKCPTKVLFVDELPRNDRGKVDRKALKG